MIFSSPPQFGQCPRSISNTRLSSLTQLSRTDLAGSAAWEQRDYAGAATQWKRLLVQIPVGTARHGELARAIDRAEQRAGMALPAPP